MRSIEGEREWDLWVRGEGGGVVGEYIKLFSSFLYFHFSIFLCFVFYF